ncbi:unnamed protein product [Oppiella nova]|uniref:Cationic amino acid transporter C-terminal domain-containing protein n=1 Tax=Oppiella nova TaxID=334625 RepID=A0A7R9QSC5_9ACAR|nr:unnamed protein product [Oppiella nova]CAG2173913.1 unnamed protein product [Oppiella nova]
MWPYYDQNQLAPLPYVFTQVGYPFASYILTVGAMAGLRQPQTDEKMSFKIPGVPLIPVLSVFVNIYLMIHLSSLTWIRFGVWMVLGMLMYFLYGVIESIGYLSDSQKSTYLREERPSFSAPTTTIPSSPSTPDLSRPQTSRSHTSDEDTTRIAHKTHDSNPLTQN